MISERYLTHFSIWFFNLVHAQADHPIALVTNSTGHIVPTVVANISTWICPAKSWKEQHLESIQWPKCIETRWRTQLGSDEVVVVLDGMAQADPRQATTVDVTQAANSTSSTPAKPSESSAADISGDQDLDTESPLDNANFLSFEDWKNLNLAKSGQSAENVGGRRQTGERRRGGPGSINNALDSLGEDAEIELDFGGFGAAETTNPASWASSDTSDGEARLTEVDSKSEETDMPDKFLQRGAGRRRNAGTTGKERTNYASFDCAATVLKTNPQCKGSSAVLIENKDSYMLNECGAENKFLILELCDDILVDTVVLANYEFFSSIFRTFRVSVSDRYPAKTGQWKELGIFEARNTRDVQVFAVENPLIWARYLRVEFLTHYGNEFYCPVSLVRVHGTTMMEEYKNDGENNRADEEASEVVHESVEPLTEEDIIAPSTLDQEQTPTTVATTAFLDSLESCNTTKIHFSKAEELFFAGPIIEVCYPDEAPTLETNSATSTTQAYQATTAVPSSKTLQASVADFTIGTMSTAISEVVPKGSEEHYGNTTMLAATTTATFDSERPISTDTEAKIPPPSARNESSSAVDPPKSTTTQPSAPNPTTQESFFKLVNKRLQMLESNSSLSLQYIEEQSRILRDAFNKVEKRQLAKTTTFLENLNTTVLNELRDFRIQYDQVWNSVALELEQQRFQYHQELYAITTQLAVLADEVVFQKRVSVVQSIFVLICLGLVLFTRSSTNRYLELPSVQNIVTRSHGLQAASPIFGTPTVSPSSTRRTSSYGGKRRHHRTPSEESPVEEASLTAYTPPTPPSEITCGHKNEERSPSSSQISLLDSAAATSRSDGPGPENPISSGSLSLPSLPMSLQGSRPVDSQQ